MNENIDLTKILKECPKGFKLYTPLCGEVEFIKVREGTLPVMTLHSSGIYLSFTKEGSYFNFSNINAECLLFPSAEQRDWSKFTAPWYKKEKLVKPKFRVGDRIRHKETNKDDVYVISKVYDDSYGVAGLPWMIYMKYQDRYELVPNKFDVTTLKPFDKVLVRDSSDRRWRCALFSHVRKEDENYTFKYITTDCTYAFCIPYNEETKSLVGTYEDAPEFYRYWED